MQLNKLMIVTHNMAGGGCERVISILANGLCARGVKVTIVTEYAHASAYQLSPGVGLEALTDRRGIGARDIPKVYLSLRRLVKRQKPDVVLAMPEKVNVWTVLFTIGTGVPVVVSERNDPKRHPENPVKRLLRRLAYPFAAGFIFQTPQQRDYFSPAIRHRGIVLDNPLCVDSLPEPFSGGRETVFVAAGRLEAQKNFPLLISAFALFHAIHPAWKLVIYGQGKLKESLEEQIRALGLEDAAVLGGRTDRLGEKLYRCGAFVLSSDFEGQPNVLLEAMALGVPCISTDCPAGGPGTLIRSGENGLLVPPGDGEAMAAAMDKIASDPVKAASMGAGAAGIRDRMDSERVITKWRTYLEQVIG